MPFQGYLCNHILHSSISSRVFELNVDVTDSYSEQNQFPNIPAAVAFATVVAIKCPNPNESLQIRNIRSFHIGILR